MATTISVNKQSVSELLKTGRTKPFIIPEYQRPYAWTSEQVETLFEDIWEFATTIGGLDRNGSYFLGSIVSFENENGEQEIIDGQQHNNASHHYFCFYAPFIQNLSKEMMHKLTQLKTSSAK